jgi:tetratricopeptide (TPR) repeat protein
MSLPALRPLVLALGLAAALGAGAAGNDAPSASGPLGEAVQAIRAERYDDAIKRLESYTLQFTRDADGWNWLGYAYRKNGQLDRAFKAYERALALDPGHRGAHEYIGEAYLMARKPAEAERHLKRLEALCPGGCEELEDLRRALAAYKAKPA